MVWTVIEVLRMENTVHAECGRNSKASEVGLLSGIKDIRMPSWRYSHSTKISAGFAWLSEIKPMVLRCFPVVPLILKTSKWLWRNLF